MCLVCRILAIGSRDDVPQSSALFFNVPSQGSLDVRIGQLKGVECQKAVSLDSPQQGDILQDLGVIANTVRK